MADLCIASVYFTQQTSMTKNQKTANILGYGGLIPFVIFSIGSWIDLPGVTQAHSVQILIAYGAIILSFMGAIHWGLAMAHDNENRSQPFIISIIPALTAWLALLMTNRWALIVLLIAFIVLYIYDRAAEKPQRLPAWYLPMRMRLTIVVALCLTGALLSA